MRTPIFLSILVGLSLFGGTLEANAGGRDVGTAGATVVCRDKQGNILSAELLDSFESRVLYKKPFDLGPDSLTMDQKVDHALDKIVQRDKTRGLRLKKWHEHFFEGVEWTNDKLPVTSDVDPTLFPKDCAIEQIAIQRNNSHNPDWYNYGPAMKIYRPLWDAFDVNQKAALIVHEIIYHEMLWGFVPTSSEPVRYFLSALLSDEFSSLSPGEYAKLLAVLNEFSMDINGLHVSLSGQSADFYPSGNPATLQVDGEQDYVWKGQTIPLQKDSKIVFADRPGDLSEATLRQTTTLATPVGLMSFREEVSFDSSGKVATGMLNESVAVPIGSYGLVNCSKNAEIQFSDHELSVCYVYGSFKGPGYELATQGGFARFIHGALDWGWSNSYYYPSFKGTVQIHGAEPGQTLSIDSLKLDRQYGDLKEKFGEAKVVQPATIRIGENTLPIDSESIVFYEGFGIFEFRPAQNFEFTANGQKIPVAREARASFFNPTLYQKIVELWPNGNLKHFTSSRSFTYNGENYTGSKTCDFDEEMSLHCHDVAPYDESI